MSTHYFSSGLAAARKRPGLTAILYVANLALGLILSIPILIAFSQSTATTGFSPEMAEGFDITLWADLLEDSGPVFQTMISQLIWILPLLFLWKVASSVGLVHALSAGGGRSFWQGVGRHTGKAALLGLLYLVPTFALIFGVAIVAVILSAFLTGEVGSFWVQFVFTPLVIFLGIAFVDMMHDFGRIELVLADKSVTESWFAGMKWPLKSGIANSIYIGWMLVGLVVLIIPVVLDFSMGSIFLAFIIQQILLFARSMVTVGWIGSEVFFFEDVQARDAPLIAGADPASI